MARAMVHLHLPRLRAFQEGRGDEKVNSVKIKGRKVFYVHSIALSDVDFKVFEKGRQRTIQTGQRNVHAWVCGEPQFGADGFWNWKRAIYSPFHGPSFVDSETLEPVEAASFAVLQGKFVYYKV